MTQYVYHKDVLPSGLRVLTVPAEGTKSLTVMVYFNTGSRFEDKKHNGISHFMEHMFFKGGKRYPDTQSVAGTIDGVGGLFNAFTSEERVSYYVKLSSSKKEIAYDVLSDMLFNAQFDEKEIDRERGVIIEEIRMYNDDPASRVAIDFQEMFFGDQPLGWDIAGPEEVILRTTRPDFMAYRERFYTAPNAVLVAAGNITRAESLALAEKYFRFENTGAKVNPVPAVNMPIQPVKFRERDLEQLHLQLGFPMPAERSSRQPAIKVLANLLGGTMSSRLFLQVRERKGLAYYIRSARTTFSDAGIFRIGAGLNTARIEEALVDITAECNRLANDGPTQAELTRAKENMKGLMDLALEDSMRLGSMYGAWEVLYGEVKTPEQTAAEIDAVTLDEVHREAKEILDFSKARLALIGPGKVKERFDARYGFDTANAGELPTGTPAHWPF